MEEKFKKLDTEDKWDELFIELQRRTTIHPTLDAKKPENFPLNRYVNIIPYDRSRVKLQRLEETDFINANTVTVPKAARQYILTQGPTEETVKHFWLMVWEQKSTVIVMLNKVMEILVTNCHQYWPPKVKGTDIHKNVGLSVTLKSEETTKHYIVRMLELEDLESGKTRAITHFQYTAWPDQHCPESPTSILRLITAVRKAGGLYKMDEPTIVHCSAGVGRSGTFCLIDSILSIVESQGSTEGVDIDNTLVEMRDYRMMLVQNSSQLSFAYKTIIYGIKILEKANKLHQHISICREDMAFEYPSSSSASPQHRANVPSKPKPKKTRRSKRKQNTANTSGSVNIFEKNLLADALDDIDSDTADNLFENAMKPWPNIKKARNGDPDDLTKPLGTPKSPTSSSPTELPPKELTAEARAEMLERAISNMLTSKKISILDDTGSSSDKSLELGESSLLKRRERDIKNQRLAERTNTIIMKMKEEESKRQVRQYRWSILKKSALVGGIATLILSSVYIYLR